MDIQRQTAQGSPESKARLRRKNKRKVFRVFVQIALLVTFAAFGILSVIKSMQNQTVNLDSAQSSSTLYAGGSQSNQFIALSYPGLTKSESLESKIINDRNFAEQIAALKSAGYVTISQNDIINYYMNYERLPQKALFLIFEDGIRNTISLAQPVLEENRYRATVCTYVNNLGQLNSNFMNASALQSLKNNPYWELGTNGYRLSYINVFDRYNNYFGHLNGSEFVKVYGYLWRDYNHYLMDFKRDEDRLRQESEQELISRIKSDYQQMHSVYLEALGSVPGLYIIMHSNTGAFGTDPVASNANRDSLTSMFSMNFNRQGTCLNTLESSIYDLSRLQVQSYFSTNHVLMRIQDDIGEQIPFVTGDEQEAAKWYVDDGVAEFKGDRMILTTQPRGEGRMTLKSTLLTDLDMTVTLEGNVAGSQSVYLRTDRNLNSGIQVSLENNVLFIREPDDQSRELFSKSLFEIDGGPFISEQEDEYNGLVALQNAIIQFDEDPVRVEEAKEKLAQLENMPVLTLDQGGTPYYPAIDISKRDSRKLRIRLVGSRLSVWVDDKPVVEQLSVSSTQMGAVAFQSKVYYQDEYSQRFLADDVYDAVFVSPQIRNVDDPDTVYYLYELEKRQTINSTITRWVNTIVEFFVDNF